MTYSDEKYPYGDGIEVTYAIIDECFLFSQMTIHNEHRDMGKYQYLLFVEFQEMFCRIAAICIQRDDPIQWKVYSLMEIIFNDMYRIGKWNPEKIPLAEVSAGSKW